MRCSRETFFAKIVKAVVMERPISAQTSSILRFRSGSIRKFTLTAFAMYLSLLLKPIICMCNEKCKKFHYKKCEKSERLREKKEWGIL